MEPKQQAEKQNIREILPFPDIEDFYDQLQDRLHMVLGQFFLDDPFTIFLTALPRMENQIIHRFENFPLDYAGIPKQREQLELNPNKSLDAHWDFLLPTTPGSRYSGDVLGTVSSKLFSEMKLGDLELKDLYDDGTGKMADYFGIISEERRAASSTHPESRREAEFHIIDKNLDISTYWYLSIPLIQFAEFDGIAHIVHSDADHQRVIRKGKDGRQNINKRLVGNIIKAFSREYEGLILDWDLVGANKEKKTVVLSALKIASRDETYIGQGGKVNPILDELKYRQYYEKHLKYFEKRFEQNDAIPGLLYQQSLKNAIITILIDSFAHNVSAHSLTALNWWFKQRASKLKGRLSLADVAKVKQILEKDIPVGGKNSKDLQDLLDPILNPYMGDAADIDDNYIVNYEGPMAKELQPLFKFLLEKGAFWSGVTRDYGFGGEVNDLFEALWRDFINNPLYLGTIAKTEEISQIAVRIVFYEPEDEALPNGVRCKVKRKQLGGGDFAIINIKKPRPMDQVDKKALEDSFVEVGGQRLYYRDHRELAERSDFVQPSPEYAEVKKALQACKVFFPGGVVGRHALYTMLENEIRNVKHYTGKDLKSIQQNGLTLAIGIQEKHVEPGKSGERELFKIGIWLKLNTDLSHPISKNQSDFLIKRKFDDLIGDVMDKTESHAPRLGGNFQDKICAAMLFNNTFASVQRGDANEHRTHADKDTPRDTTYYPWIIPATASEDAPHEDFELTRENEPDFDRIYPHKGKKGRFKKYFHCWKGANVKELPGHLSSSNIEQEEFWSWDNLSRFRFINIQKEDGQKKEPLRSEVRKHGVIRVIGDTIPKDWLNDAQGRGTALAYRSWLPHWLGPSQLVIELKERPKGQNNFVPKGYLVFDGANPLNTPDDQLLNQTFYYAPVSEKPEMPIRSSLKIAHAGTTSEPGVIRYRTHGIYKQYFTEVMEPPAADGAEAAILPAAKIAELIEAMTTRIAIFDNRVRHRIKEKKRDDFFRNTLGLMVDSEHTPVQDKTTQQWEGDWEFSKSFIKDCHFLVMHLTYIESILRVKYGKEFSEDDSEIGYFIEKELQPLILDDNGKIRENFVFVVTTGRGRNKWWDRLKESKNPAYQAYKLFTIFRPVESIISIVENAINKEDDIELKYYLTKLLFGS